MFLKLSPICSGNGRHRAGFSFDTRKHAMAVVTVDTSGKSQIAVTG
jgi:hypothetical protein